MATQPVDDWIEWSGGECPVDADAKVFIQLGTDSREEAERDGASDAGSWEWDHQRPPEDRVIAYRKVQA